jgi:hypothetical protein
MASSTPTAGITCVLAGAAHLVPVVHLQADEDAQDDDDEFDDVATQCCSFT